MRAGEVKRGFSFGRRMNVWGSESMTQFMDMVAGSCSVGWAIGKYRYKSWICRVIWSDEAS